MGIGGGDVKSKKLRRQDEPMQSMGQTYRSTGRRHCSEPLWASGRYRAWKPCFRCVDLRRHMRCTKRIRACQSANSVPLPFKSSDIAQESITPSASETPGRDPSLASMLTMRADPGAAHRMFGDRRSLRAEPSACAVHGHAGNHDWAGVPPRAKRTPRSGWYWSWRMPVGPPEPFMLSGTCTTIGCGEHHLKCSTSEAG
jgi:hypothetical protein